MMYLFGHFCKFAELIEGECSNHKSQNKNLQAFTYFISFARGW